MKRVPPAVRDILRGPRPKVLFAGAGVSKDFPTGFPLAAEISKSIITGISRGDSFLKYHAALIQRGIDNNLSGCRFEVLLEIARQGIGDRVVRILSILDKGIPNAYHYLLASALYEGHMVVTTNFDMMIEQAYGELHRSGPRLTIITTENGSKRAARRKIPKRLLFKIHGSLRDCAGRLSYGSIQLTLASLANGLPPGKRRLLQALLGRFDFIFMGYSGRDDFDIRPFLASAQGAGRFLWAKYADREIDFLSSANLARTVSEPDHIDSLIIGKGNSYIAEGRTKDLLPLLPCYDHSFTTSSRSPSTDWRTALADVISKLSLSVHERTRYIAKVLQYNGYFREAKRCLEKNTRVSDGLDRAVAFDDLAQCHFLLRDFVSDLHLRRRARSLARKYRTDEARNLVARTWLGAGESYRNTARYAEAAKCFLRAGEIYKRLNKPEKVGYCLAGVAGINRMISRFDNSERAGRQAISFFRRGKDLTGLLYARWGLGELWKYRGLFPKALRVFHDIRAQAEDMGHQGLIPWTLWSEAEILRLQWKTPEALSLYTRAINIFPPHDLAGRCWGLEGRAQCKTILGISPLDDIESALEGFAHLGAAIGKAAALLDKTIFSLRLGHLKDASSTLREINSDSLPPKDRANFDLVTAELYRLKGDAGAKPLYKRSAATYRSLGMRHAFVTAVILQFIQYESNATRFNRRRFIAALRFARQGDYVKEVEIIRQLLKGEMPEYMLNLY
jgi:tetratricopeptide (TPR) repeat protein